MMKNEISAVLTPEQQSKLEEMKAKHKGKRGRRGMRGERGNQDSQ
jgi:Spy/CpxP family protein refolding chaperone